MTKRILITFLKDENAQAMVEYVLVASILIAASYGAIRLFLHAWKSKYDNLKNMRTGPQGALI